MKNLLLCSLILLFSSNLKAQVTADFELADLKDTLLCGDYDIELVDLSTGNITSWQWFMESPSSFSTQQNPQTTVPYLGAAFYSYGIMLVVSDGVFTDTLFKPNYITRAPIPYVNWWSPATEDPIAVGENVSMTNYSYPEWGNELYYIWDFKDGTTDTSQNPIHSYSSQGTYHVVLHGIQDTLRPACRDSAIFTIEVSGFLSQELLDECVIEVYPNPVSKILTISGDEPFEQMELFDLSGKLVALTKVTGQAKNHNMNLGHLKSGEYILVITQSDKKKRSFSIVKE